MIVLFSEFPWSVMTPEVKEVYLLQYYPRCDDTYYGGGEPEEVAASTSFDELNELIKKNYPEFIRVTNSEWVYTHSGERPQNGCYTQEECLTVQLLKRS